MVSEINENVTTLCPAGMRIGRMLFEFVSRV
jgi:hypothetical protein